MQTYSLTLESKPSKSFYSQKAADSLDIDTAKKLAHTFTVEADLESDYNIGLIVGASGSGKTTLAQHVFGADCFTTLLKPKQPIIDQFPKDMDYNARAAALNGVGLTQVVCWIRPAATLSNGQRERAEIALQLAYMTSDATAVVDEWTSVVDRTVAKVMSHCIQKHARRANARVVLCSCHYDVIEWLDPDWVVDCNKQTYTDRRCLQRGQREERLAFHIAPCDRSAWRFFSRYHYLSERMPGGLIRTFGIYHNAEQIGFICYANYTPKKPGMNLIMHMNRVVIHPDYAGFGLGIQFINLTSAVVAREGIDVRAKYSSRPVHKAMMRDPRWTLMGVSRQLKLTLGATMERKGGFRRKVTMYTYRFTETEEAPLQLEPH